MTEKNIQELWHWGLPLANHVTERACLFFAERARTSKGRSCPPLFANELPPQGSLENKPSKSLKQPAAGIRAFVSERLCLRLGAPFHPFGSPVSVHLPCHSPFTNPSAPAAAFSQLLALLHCTTRGLDESSVAAVRGEGWCCRAASAMLGRGGGSDAEGETRFHATPHHRQEHASPGIKGTAVIPTAIPALRDLQGRGSKPLHLFLFFRRT